MVISMNIVPYNIIIMNQEKKENSCKTTRSARMRRPTADACAQPPNATSKSNGKLQLVYS